jgi:DNA-directed RNA polymerase specialized sigma24 family protein
MGTTTVVIDMRGFDFAHRGKTKREMGAVISSYLPSFYRHAFRHLGNCADAEDAVQDALLSAHKLLSHKCGDSSDVAGLSCQ